jgi:hypothetical protein
MNYVNQVFCHADGARKEIKRIVASDTYDSGDFRYCVDALRDGLITLARDLDFGRVAKLLKSSEGLLEYTDSNARWHAHNLKQDDLLYFIQTFPTPPQYLIKDISADVRVNNVIVDSVVRSQAYEVDGTVIDFNEMAYALASHNDHQAWLKLVLSSPNTVKGVKLAMNSLGTFDPEYLQAHRNDFDELVTNIRMAYTPNDFAWMLGNRRIDSDALFAALKILDCGEKIEAILKVCWLEFSEPFTLQRIMKTYDLVPDPEYRGVLARAAHASDGNVAQTKYVATSYYLHELSIPDEICESKRLINVGIVKDVLSLDGAETPYGVFNYLPHKVGAFLDNVLKLAVEDQKGDVDTVCAVYKDAIPHKYLMQSGFYKGHTLSNALGL